MNTSSTLPDNIITSMKSKNIWTNNCPISLDKLRLLTLDHYDFNNNLIQGEMVVHEKIATNIISIFQELFKMKFPIARIKLLDHYDGNDEISMTDNNSSCFNYRSMTNSNITSMHSYGLAVDINPVQNPYIIDEKIDNNLKIWPNEGKLYLNRNHQRPGMIEPVAYLFSQYGLNIWGGNWDTPIDYHHFQIDRKNLAEFL